ncbi:MAG: hypothetical protein P4L53_08680 [Candidatus Obscuribacterales bacterium]|nr:hypothetical protein [Candidatus Obscuribacterales bacterium]
MTGYRQFGRRDRHSPDVYTPNASTKNNRLVGLLIDGYTSDRKAVDRALNDCYGGCWRDKVKIEQAGWRKVIGALRYLRVDVGFSYNFLMQPQNQA